MKILLLGGGRQIGYYLLNNLLQDKNNIVFVFNRGNKNFLNFRINKYFKGDRNTNYHLIKEYHFDCIIDTCLYNPTLSFKSLEYFSKKTDKYIMISSSYVHSYLDKKSFIFNKKIHYDQKKNIYNYARNKYKCENLITKIFKNYTIIRTVPIISDIDHTNRTSNFLKYLMNKNNYFNISNKEIQINSVNEFSKQIINNINFSKKNIIEYSGSIVKISNIYNYLGLQNNKNKIIMPENLILPFFEFISFFPGLKTPEKYILNVFKEVFFNLYTSNE